MRMQPQSVLDILVSVHRDGSWIHRPAIRLSPCVPLLDQTQVPVSSPPQANANWVMIRMFGALRRSNAAISAPETIWPPEFITVAPRASDRTASRKNVPSLRWRSDLHIVLRTGESQFSPSRQMVQPRRGLVRKTMPPPSMAILSIIIPTHSDAVRRKHLRRQKLSHDIRRECDRYRQSNVASTTKYR